MDDSVVVELRMAEALVLFDWLANVTDQDSLNASPTELGVLWGLESQLEGKLPMIFDSDYREQVVKARHEVNDPGPK
ncbi:hypothetical protein [Streptomyces sp. AC495_CC817]|uniref:hypothetical protein n=1 Tax=Streptomyces sp. AC495_CC817 TaxID=2823900 RepID=UPI001C2780D7|nr:hypothetical protein [Streptomyces sp. AC495_CC817]